MTANLRLVVDNAGEDTEKLLASIRPLDREVAPSDQFRRRVKLQLLDLSSGKPDPAQAA